MRESTKPYRIFLVAAFTALPLACTSTEMPAVEVVACGAVDCVLNHRPAHEAGAVLALSETPELTLSGVRPEEPESGFGAINGLARLADGSIVVADGMARQLHRFAPDGTWIDSSGGRGEGPGEYVGLRWMDLCWPDRLAVLDRQTIVEVDPGGEHLERHDVIEMFGQRPMFVVCDGGGRFLGLGIDNARWRGVVGEGIVRPDGEATLVDEEGQRPLGRFAVGEIHRQMTDGGFHPLARVTRIALTEAHAWIGTADAFEIEQYDHGGRLLRRVRRDWELFVLEPGIVREILERELATMPPRVQDFWRNRLGPDDNPPSLPAYDAFLTDAAGRLWVHQYVVPGESGNRWSVFDGDGRWVTDVEMPLGFEPHAIGAGWILGVAPDPLENPRVVLYSLSSV